MCVFLRQQSGEFFGEYSCLLSRKRACSVTAAQASEVYILSKKILESALEKWPELAVELHEMGEKPSFLACSRKFSPSVVNGISLKGAVDLQQSFLNRIRIPCFSCRFPSFKLESRVSCCEVLHWRSDAWARVLRWVVL
jgi:hypothetical protein